MEDYVSKAVHDEFAKRIEEENTRQNHRISNLENAISQLSELITSVKILAVNVENIANEISEQGIRLKEIEGKPAKRWETVIGCIITAIITATISFLINK